MKTRSTCPDCGVAIGQPHISNCDVERCSVCARQKITCCCEGHDPQASVWTGEWPGSEDYVRFLAELEEIEADMSAASGDHRYPNFVPDQRDMEQLAHSYLDEAVSLFCFSFFTGICFSFFTGNCEERRACLLMDRFEQVAQNLGDSKRREIIDRLNIHRSAKDGDQWEVFKFTCKPDFWSTPVKMDAVQRVADSILEDLPPDQDHFGPEFLDTLRVVREEIQSTEWNKEGF